MTTDRTHRRRGTPLVMLALVLGTWAVGRAAMWESPFPLPDLPEADFLIAERKLPGGSPNASGQYGGEGSLDGAENPMARIAVAGLGGQIPPPGTNSVWTGYSALNQRSPIAAGHHMLMTAAFEVDWHSSGLGIAFGSSQRNTGQFAAQVASSAPFAAPPGPARPGRPDRWSFDAIAYYRAGSGSPLPSQGRTPVYGASQASANLQYRVAPTSSHDPRAYLRAYQALVTDGETEIAAGISARPAGQVPLRLAGEIRATRSPFGTDFRPAGYAVTELGPQRLPLRFSLETYAAAGYVGGEAETYFVDGQASLTREVVRIDGLGGQPLRLSLGGGAWGGAQKDASRVDIGPTVRLDLSVGSVPARVSVDWRERVGGDAEPDSGVAATVSTRF